MSDLHRAGGLRLDFVQPRELLKYQAAAPQLRPFDLRALPTTQGYRKFHHRELQARQNSCRGHATTACLEKAYWCQTKGLIRQYNREFSYLTGQKLDGLVGDVGASMIGGCKAAIKYGMALEASWPYTGEYPAGGFTAIPAPVFAEARKTVLGSYRVLQSYEQVIQWLADGIGGVQIGIEWNESCQPDANNQLRSYRPGPFEGDAEPSGHALALLDWDKQQTDARGYPYVWMANWHEGYGDEFGGAWVAPKIVDYWCQHFEVIGMADVAGDVIAPRDMDWIKGFI